MNTLRSVCAWLVMLLSCALPAFADELKLANGDRLTGTVVSLTSGVLRFKTPNGELQVPWKDVTSLTTDHQLLVRTAAGPAQLITLSEPLG